ncbi:MAG: hypothetical protein ACP5HG_07110 [Anaerolineae bacterium]
MGALNQTQKIILLVLAVLDVVVIGGMAAIVITSRGAPADPAPVASPTKPLLTLAPTWTATVTTTPRPTLPSRPTNTPRATRTPVPTATETPTATPLPPEPVALKGADFDFIMPNRIPGWEWDVYVNYKPGEDFNTESSYAEAMFTAADDPARQIHGTTLKIETIRWLKFRAWVHQTVNVTAGSRAYFKIQAKAFSSLDSLIVKAGIDPTGSGSCHNARWGQEMRINQNSGTVTLTSPTVIVAPVEEVSGDEEEASAAERTPGRVTVCFFAEPTYPHVNNAAFFDLAELVVTPPR